MLFRQDRSRIGENGRPLIDLTSIKVIKRVLSRLCERLVLNLFLLVPIPLSNFVRHEVLVPTLLVRLWFHLLQVFLLGLLLFILLLYNVFLIHVSLYLRIFFFFLPGVGTNVNYISAHFKRLQGMHVQSDEEVFLESFLL